MTDLDSIAVTAGPGMDYPNLRAALEAARDNPDVNLLIVLTEDADVPDFAAPKGEA